MKIEAFTRGIWDMLVCEDEHHQNRFRVGPDWVGEWSFHTPEFQFMKIFFEKNRFNLMRNKDLLDRGRYEKSATYSFKKYGRVITYSVYTHSCSFLMIPRQSLINIYDCFVDEAQEIKERKFGEKLATVRRPYFMERFNQDETFLQWLRDPSRKHIL